MRVVYRGNEDNRIKIHWKPSKLTNPDTQKKNKEEPFCSHGFSKGAHCRTFLKQQHRGLPDGCKEITPTCIADDNVFEEV